MTWEEEFFPYDLGDGVHRWGWLMSASNPSDKNILWLHRCGDKNVACWIDIASGERHTLVSEEPLTLEPSILCPIGCGDHGYVREGRWIAA